MYDMDTANHRLVSGTGISADHSLTPVCDVLRAELRDVNEQTESAATLFIGRLDNIDGVVNQLGTEVGGLVGLAENRANHMEILVTHNSEVVNQVTGFLTTRDEAIRALIDEVRDLQRFAESVRDIVRISRILALNARIESAHAGEIGRGFAIIAQEMLALAGQSDQAARDITNGIAHLTKKMSETLGDHDLAGHMSQISDANDELFGAFKTATNEVGGVAQNVQSHVDILGHFTTELAGAMQFQDIARQQVEHVIAGLDSVEKHSELLIGHVRGEVPVEKVLEGVTMLDKIFDGYVMERQRHVHHQAIGDHGQTVADGPAIELF